MKTFHRHFKQALLIRSISLEILLPRGQFPFIQTVAGDFLKVIAQGSALIDLDSRQILSKNYCPRVRSY